MMRRRALPAHAFRLKWFFSLIQSWIAIIFKFAFLNDPKWKTGMKSGSIAWNQLKYSIIAGSKIMIQLEQVTGKRLQVSQLFQSSSRLITIWD